MGIDQPDYLEHVAEIIKAAAASGLGIIALMVIALSALAFLFFKGAGAKVRVPIFLVLFCGFAAFGAAYMIEAGKSNDSHPTPTPTPATPTPTLATPTPATPTPTPSPTQTPPHEAIKTIAANVPNWQGDVQLAADEYAVVTILENGKTWTNDAVNYGSGYGNGPTDHGRPWPMVSNDDQGQVGALLFRIDTQEPQSFSNNHKEMRFEGPEILRFMMNDSWWDKDHPEHYHFGHRNYPDWNGSKRNAYDKRGELDVRIRLFKKAQ